MHTLSAHKRGYGVRWQRARLVYLKNHPLCVLCMRDSPPRFTHATVIDHIIAHKGNHYLFWSPTNWQPLCKPCHDNAKRQLEVRGYDSEIGSDGWPTDANHPFNRR